MSKKILVPFYESCRILDLNKDVGGKSQSVIKGQSESARKS